MDLKKFGVTVDCEHCQFASSGTCGEFDVTVPVGGKSIGDSGIARLHCLVSSECHSVELAEWEGVDASQADLPLKARQSVAAALEHVAARRVCGNRHICPSEVIRIVEESEKPAS